MELNKDIEDILKEYKIPVQAGLLVLLGIYFKLDVEKVVPEEIIKAINLTKIVEKDYRTKSLTWNVPLFAGQDIEFGWVKDWIEGFGRINPDRRGSWRDATARMKDFFKKYPSYRKDDVYKARDLYFSTVKDSQYLISSHKFIFDGMGAMKKSSLLGWCEKVTSTTGVVHQRGKIL